MTLNWYEDTTGPWVLQHTDYNCTNGTYNWVYTNATAYSHLYYWMVIANDTTSNTSRIYHFTTEAYVPPVNHPPNTPSNPDPSNHATGVDIDKNMSWTGGDPDGDAVTYDVYFNNSVTLVKVSSNQSGLTYDPGTMTYSETYYWRIVAWDSHGERTTGPVWDFTIMATPWTTVETINGSIRNVTYGVQIINIYPGNNSHIQKTQPTLLFTLFNSTGVSNFTVFTGNSTANATYFLFNDSYVGNGTYHSSYFNATEYYTDYYWRVCVWDNGAWLNETYSFNIIHESGGGSQGNVAFGILGIFGIFGLVGFIMVLRMRKRKKGNGET